MTRVSLVVPVYNAAADLPVLLHDLAAQGLADMEFVLVDDGSTDATPELLRAFAARDSRARVLSQANGGPSRARNAGIAAARGEVIVFADADDRLAPALGECVADAMHARSLDVLCFNGRRIDSRGADVAEPFYRQAKPAEPVSGAAWIAFTQPQGEFLQYVWLMACRAELARRAPFVEGMLHEDVPWTCDVLLAAARVGYLDRELYRYRTTPQSLMRAPGPAARQRRIDGYFAVVAHLVALAARPGLPLDTREALARHAAQEAGHVFRLARELPRAQRGATYARARDAGLPRLLWRHAQGLNEHRRALRAAALATWARRAPQPETR